MTATSIPSPARTFEEALLSTLAYADIFDHPLRLEEIQRYFPYAVSQERLRSLLEQSGLKIERVGDYHLLAGRSAIVQTRIRREAASRRLWRRAGPLLHAVAAFPFVRMIAVTGTLATDSAEEGDDVDLFVVTAPGRLWTCRAMILLLARLARLRGLRLCPNYLVTERALELPEQTLYVARELAQMVPLSGFAVYDRMRALNRWADAYLPNAGGPPPSCMRFHAFRAIQLVQRLMEGLLWIAPLRIAEAWEMRRKIARLGWEQASSPESYFSADVCKGHMGHYGLRIAARLENRLAEMDSADTAAVVMMEIRS